ncbi:MAG: AlwI family type II restriction endonuclease, partial [Oscillospiraceae bacterium]|nr:AlwI family type II restriction endonuclease [Oscillospiraceae bacterium]
RKALFQTTARTKVQQEKLRVLTDVPIFNVGSESEFKQLFFEMLHLYKAKATLTDYFDLNRRYCKTTDTLLFADGKVEFDVIPACWIKNISEQLPQIAFAPIDTLAADTELSEIASFLEIDTNKLYSDLERLFGIHITSGEYASDGNNVFVNAIVYSPNSSQYISEDCKRKITKTIGYNSERIQIFTTNMLPTIRACIVYDDKQKPLWCSLQSYQYEYDKLPLTELSVQSDLFTFVVDNKDDYKDYKDSKDTLKAITDTIEAEFTRLKG